ncbi:MAG: transcription antitermination factor NusB [Candidatus Hydrothermota bacterium]|nr:MAG: transcription antitermination factor NusB [Candidatus Hydrothermae bacterium]RKZ04055.1 MAG: transcription antitermination factor NusB [Candidatus Hydrothermae bacterium]
MEYFKDFGGRRLSRILVMEALYRFQLLGEDPREALEDIIKREEPPEEVAKFARELLDAVVRNLDKIDELIKETSFNWEIDRIAYLDRAILRLGIGEMMGLKDIPFRVTISEAIELAKTFSTVESGRFVNGILDAIATKLGLKEEVI